MLSAWPPVTASCATATSSASTDAESRRFVVIRLCYIRPTIVGTSCHMASCFREPDALVPVAASPVHSRNALGHAADRVEKLRRIYLAVRATPVPPANGGGGR